MSLIYKRREFAVRDLNSSEAGVTILKELDEICISDVGILGVENASDESSVVLLGSGAECISGRIGKSCFTAEIVLVTVFGSAYESA